MNTKPHLIFHHSSSLLSLNLADLAAWLTPNPSNAFTVPHWAPSPQLVKCGRARSGCEKTRGFLKRPYQPVDAADVRRRVAFGARAYYRQRGKLSDGGSSLSTFAGTASSASALEVAGALRSNGRNKLFLFLSAAAVGVSRTESSPSCWRCFTLLMAGRNPFGGTLGDDGDPAGPTQGRAVLAGPVQLGPLPRAGGPSICLG
ncbi:hypothetical protein THAOC_02490 [Thalassiosira oceanica]|uniref:DUF6743 domain-containing protein n=1 Tax=Thalassiosira oceanica TaxID=159749 RepID=K0TQB9_THAOC|nr:hypothetical protein THAOC_02490 [Thalassiosira oceanica]|eukprot:EJK75777.1 hypothetical protein THAOC_02490 [Thalassiosira oceanica]